MSSIIILMGVALILINGSKNGQLSTAWSIISDNTVLTGTAAQQSALLLLGGEILLVIVLATIADQNKSFGYFGIALLGALWLVWMVKNPSALSSITTPLSGGNNPLNQSNTFSIPNLNTPVPISHFSTPFTLNNSLLRSATNTKG